MMKIKYKLFLLLAVNLFFLSCPKSPFSPKEYDELTEILETANFIFHYSPGDYVNSTWQEVYHEWAIGQLGVICPKKIDYYKYLNRGHMKRLTGREANAWAQLGAFSIHTIWPVDNHECVHCYTSLIGMPSAFFSEGIAVAFSTNPYDGDYEARWWGSSVHYWAKRYKDEGTLIPLNDMLTSGNFRKFDDMITYPESGSFVRFMIDNYGMDKMKSFYQIDYQEETNLEIKQNFLSIYGFSIDQAEEEWLIFVDSY